MQIQSAFGMLLAFFWLTKPGLSQGLSHSFAEWRGDECLVADPTGTALNVRQSPKGTVVDTLNNGDGVVVLSPKKGEWIEVGHVTVPAMKKIGWVWSKYIDCSAGRIRGSSPIFFESTDALVDIGISWLEEKTPDEFVKCPYQGEAHTISISKLIVYSHRKRGFNIDKLCLMLAAGSVRYDPESGRRLNTYLFSGWPDYGFFPEEFLLEVPDCFKSGAVQGKGTYWHKFKPTGCRLNFHPWTGRRLSVDEKAVYARALSVDAGGEAGAGGSSSSLRENNLPRASGAKLEDIKRKLKSNAN